MAMAKTGILKRNWWKKHDSSRMGYTNKQIKSTPECLSSDSNCQLCKIKDEIVDLPSSGWGKIAQAVYMPCHNKVCKNCALGFI